MATMTNTLFAKPDYNQHRVLLPIPPATAVVADTTVLADLLAANLRVPIDCLGYETVKGYVKLTGGVTPTVDVQPLELVTDSAGSQLVVLSSTVSGLSTLGSFEFTINGGRLLVRIDAVTGTPTKIEIFLAGSKRDNNDLGRVH